METEGNFMTHFIMFLVNLNNFMLKGFIFSLSRYHCHPRTVTQRLMLRITSAIVSYFTIKDIRNDASHSSKRTNLLQ